MENTATKNPVMLYTEQTPNPETLKFVTNRMLYKGTADFREEALAKEWSPIAEALFATALGLVAAIPAVIAYNGYSNRLGRYAGRLDAFVTEFTAILSRHLETQDKSSSKKKKVA